MFSFYFIYKNTASNLYPVRHMGGSKKQNTLMEIEGYLQEKHTYYSMDERLLCSRLADLTYRPMCLNGEK